MPKAVYDEAYQVGSVPTSTRSGVEDDETRWPLLEKFFFYLHTLLLLPPHITNLLLDQCPNSTLHIP